MSEFYTLPDSEGHIIDDYEFSVIVPVGDVTNLSGNSFELSQYDDDVTDAIQMYGTYSYTLSSGFDTILDTGYDITATEQLGTYYFSLAILGNSGEKVTLSLGNVIKEFTLNGYKQTIGFVTQITTIPGFSNVILGIKHSHVVTSDDIYIDGLFLAKVDYEIDYFDGSYEDFLIIDDTFYSNDGGFNTTNTTKTANTRKMGRIVPFDNYGFTLTNIIGLGVAPLNTINTKISNGGAIYQRTNYTSRQFSLLGRFESTDKYVLSKNISAFEKDISPFGIVPQQEIVLKIDIKNCDGIPYKTVFLPCTYVTGLEGKIDNYNNETVTITFEQSMPFMEEKYVDSGSEITSNRDAYLLETSGGVYREIFIELPDGTYEVVESNGSINGIAVYGNTLYVVGAFTSIGGVAANYAAKRNSDGVWSSNNSGGFFAPTAALSGMDIDPDSGNLFAWGAGGKFYFQFFGSIDWDTIRVVATQTTFNASINCATVDSYSGLIYIGGDFTGDSVGATTYSNRIAVFNMYANGNASALSALTFTGISLSGDCDAIKFNPVDRIIYITGDFTYGGCFYDTQTTNLSKFYLEYTSSPKFELLPDGSVLFGANKLEKYGSLSNPTNVYLDRCGIVIKWNGVTWQRLSGDFIYETSTGSNNVNLDIIKYDKNMGKIYVGGFFDTVGEKTTYNFSLLEWDSNGYMRVGKKAISTNSGNKSPSNLQDFEITIDGTKIYRFQTPLVIIVPDTDTYYTDNLFTYPEFTFFNNNDVARIANINTKSLAVTDIQKGLASKENIKFYPYGSNYGGFLPGSKFLGFRFNQGYNTIQVSDFNNYVKFNDPDDIVEDLDGIIGIRQTTLRAGFIGSTDAIDGGYVMEITITTEAGDVIGNTSANKFRVYFRFLLGLPCAEPVLYQGYTEEFDYDAAHITSYKGIAEVIPNSVVYDLGGYIYVNGNNIVDDCTQILVYYGICTVSNKRYFMSIRELLQ